MRFHLVVFTVFVSNIFSAANAQTAQAHPCGIALTAQFYESAPRDRFEFTNQSKADWQVNSIMLELDGSAGQLIFDTEDGGIGVEVFQPYKTERGEAMLVDIEIPSDGDQQIALTFRDFKPAEKFVFSIDLDDRLKKSALGQIRVSGGELAGSRLSVRFENKNGELHSVVTDFLDKNLATIYSGDC